MRILLSAYGCHPYKGSEPGVGWNWLKELSKYNEIWVMFYEGEAQYESLLKEIPKLKQLKNIHLVPINTPNFFEKRFYKIKYEIWEWLAYKKAIELNKKIKFEIIHHVTIAAWWNCGHLWKIDVPFIIGPISGGQKTPKNCYYFLRFQDILKEMLRDLLIFISWNFWRRPQNAFKKANLIFVANAETQKLFSKYKSKIKVMSEIGCELPIFKRDYNKRVDSIKLLWNGFFLPSKNFGLIIDVLRLIPDRFVWELKVIGNGHLLNYWKDKTSKEKFSDKVKFLGFIPKNEISNFYEWADIFLFPSLREATGTVVIEALSYSLPVIALNMNGARQVLSDGAGVLIDVKRRKQIISDFRNELEKLMCNQELRENYGNQAVKRVKDNYLWSKRGEVMNAYYRSTINP